MLKVRWCLSAVEMRATGWIQDLMAHKLVFIETVDVVETTLALDNFRRACDCGRGAVFFSVARGKVSHFCSSMRLGTQESTSSGVLQCACNAPCVSNVSRRCPWR